METRYPDGRERGGLTTVGEKTEGPRWQRQDTNSPHKSESRPQRKANAVLPKVIRKSLQKFLSSLQFFRGVLLFFLNLSIVFSLSYLETVASAFSKYT